MKRASDVSIVPPRQSQAIFPQVKPTEKLIVQLGRYGDIINILPFALYLSKKIKRPVSWLVHEQHASIFEGVSYVKLIICDDKMTLQTAIRAYEKTHSLIVTQAWLNPDARRLTDSFTKEQWRHANAFDERGKWPLIFDKRDFLGEQRLINEHVAVRTRPLILVATSSISTPYKHADRLIAMIRGLNADVIDLDNVKAEYVYDLLALYQIADCLVTVDTMHLHLARASYCPVVALLNDGWRGSTPTPQTIASWRYSTLGDNLEWVVEAVEKQIARRADSIAVVINTFKPDTDRHWRAIETHPDDAIYAKFDHRPKIRELLSKGLNTGKDVVMFTNDDVAITEGSIEAILAHAKKWDFGCSRRPRDPIHIGREVFWFRSDFLMQNWDTIPDCYWTVQKPDLILVKWMRGLLGIPTTMDNLYYDLAPVDVPAGIITHEDHPSAWANPATENSMEGQYNEAIWEAMK